MKTEKADSSPEILEVQNAV